VLAAMPQEWIEQLHQAATVGDTEVILQLSERLAESNGAIAQVLINWVNEFRFDLITNLTESHLRAGRE
jgi:hypothetical protein